MSVSLLDPEAYGRALALRDLTDAAHGPHAMQLLVHDAMPHQLDLWRVARRALGRAELEEMIDVAAHAMLPGARLVLSPATHPYTVDGLEVHADIDGRAVEILECGLAAPRILEEAGWRRDEHHGLAMGIGLDRMLMLRNGVADIRALRSTDPRIAAQMLDLEPYRPVSLQPAMRRDLSIAVPAETTPEEIGDRARHALGARCTSIEAIEVLGETPYADLSHVARERLGIGADQKNVLLRVVIRDLERTLTAVEANSLRDEIYSALHAGSSHTWAPNA